MTVWVVRGGNNGEIEGAALERGLALIGWPAVGDLTDVSSKDTMRGLLQQSYPNSPNGRIINHATSLWYFRADIEVGDLIVMPRKGQKTIVVGEVLGEYEYRPEFEKYPNVRKVKWIGPEVGTDSLAPDLWEAVTRPVRTVSKLRKDRENLLRDILRLPPLAENPQPPASWSALAEKLLWEPGQLQEIIDDLEEKGQVIFYGPPGTGKTYVAQEVAKECKRNGGGFEIVQFHPSYSYEDFVEGFRPRLIDGHPGFELVQGPLRRIAEKARNNHHATFILVIDELNRGNVSKVLGELYFLLEYRDESVRLQYGGDGEGFSLPPNLWFICTMNTADRSIALMDAALRRRFYFAPFFPDEPPVKGLLHRWLTKNGHGTWVADLVDAANKKLDRDSGIGPSYFMGDGQTLDESRVRRIWKRAVMPYIEEQCFGDSEKLKEFEFDRLKQEIDGTAPGPGNAPPHAVPSGEPAPAQANDADTNTA